MDFNKLICACKENGINDVEILVKREASDSFSLFDFSVIDNKTNDSNYANIRAKIGDKLVSYYAENLNDLNIAHIVKSLKDMASVLESSSNSSFASDTNKVNYSFNLDNDFHKFTKKEKIDYFLNLSKVLKEKSDKVKHVRISYAEITNGFEIKNSEGLDKKSLSVYGNLFIQVVVENKESRAAFYSKQIENFSDIDTNDIYTYTVEEALRQLGATSLESKKYKVILKNTCMVELLKAFKGQFSSLSLLNNMTSLKDKVGKKVFGENINIIDDPYKDKFNCVPFDTEGVETKKKYVVKDGTFVDFMYNLDTASKLNKTTSGNGFKENGIKGNVGVGPTNLYLEEGTLSLDDVFKEMGEGVYITNFQGMHAGINPISGDFNLQSSGYLIQDGKIAKPVTLIIVSGNFFEMLNKVETIGSDLEFKFGVGSPSILIEDLNISGK